MTMSSPEGYLGPVEVELRAFDIDSEKLRITLTELGARSLGVLNFKRAVLDVDPPDPNKWIRVRSDGQKTTLAVKERLSLDADGTGEVEIETSGFDETLAVLRAVHNFTPRSIQESRRELYDLDGAEVSIDTWPQIGDILEIEAEDATQINLVAERLGIDTKELTGTSVEQHYLDVLGIDVKTTAELRFDT